MTAEKAIYNFFSGFGLNTVRAGSIYSGNIRAKLPYIILPDFSPYNSGETGEASLEIWYRDGEDWASPEGTERLIAAAVPLYGRTIESDEGFIRLSRGKPFTKQLPQTKDNELKCLKVNIVYEYSMVSSKISFSNGKGRSFDPGIGCEVIINRTMFGGKAVSITGQVTVDNMGMRKEIRVMTDWVLSAETDKLAGMVAASPALKISIPYINGSISGEIAEEYIVDMPIIKQVSRNPKDGDCCKAEIRAITKEAYAAW